MAVPKYQRRRLDISGQRFGKWTVVGYARLDDNRGNLWTCRCDCGASSDISVSALTHGKSTQCRGCCHRLDLTGIRFGRRTVISSRHQSDANGDVLWICRCDCGAEDAVRASALNKGKADQCRKCAMSSKVTLRIRPFEALFNRTLANAIRDGHEFTITYEEFAAFASAGECHYCLNPVKFAMYCLANNGQAYNLDRTDNSLGYVSGNLVVCCKRCNHAKGNRFTYAEWFGMTEYFRNAPAHPLVVGSQAAS